MVTKLLSLYCGAHLVESYCKEANISDTNQLAAISFFIIFVQNLVEYEVITWLICIFKKTISLEQKEIFENSKQHFSSHTEYLFMF